MKSQCRDHEIETSAAKAVQISDVMSSNEVVPETELLGNSDPQMQAVLALPENMALVKRSIGLEELVVRRRNRPRSNIVRSRSW